MNNTLYEEGCNAIRHYSSHVKDLRKLIVVEGFVIITASFFLMKQALFHYSLFLAIFGLAFTLSLWLQQRNYMGCFNSHLMAIKNIESSVTHGDSLGPWITYDENRNQRFKSRWYRYGVIEGPTIIIAVAFLGILFFSAANYRTENLHTENKQVVEILLPKHAQVQIKNKP